MMGRSYLLSLSIIWHYFKDEKIKMASIKIIRKTLINIVSPQMKGTDK